MRRAFGYNEARTARRGGRNPARAATCAEKPEMAKKQNLTMSLEDYLECVYMLLLAAKPARVRDIAASLGVTTPSVVNGIASLKRLGYVLQEPYGSVELTPSGLDYAKAILHKHEMLTTFLRFVGSPEDIAESDACKIEHVVSPTTLDAVERFLKRHKVPIHVERLFQSK